LQPTDVFAGEDRFGGRTPLFAGESSIQEGNLGRPIGIAELGFDQEAIELGLGKREDTLAFDRVLSCDHEKRVRE
jgi:hypothetical protein